ncbi:MAG: SUMF1/EgtB/PvdO family nonheme iron enzyme, partial [Chloroflexota bacterium]|nr:SUMF1/EgtB/PvdO family nonheme iron enzyme [Chloroflexota bacterium]
DYEIYVYTLATGRIRQVTYNSCADWSPVWSPDGSKFAFYSDCDGNREIYVMNIDASNRRRLTYENAIDWFPAWSPDGDSITFTSYRGGRYNVFVMDADGSRQTSLAPGCVSGFSPNGKKILYGQYCNTDDYGAISIMKANGSNARVMDDNSNRNAVWSPGGGYIVFQSKRTGNAEIWIMDADGSNPVQLTNNSAKDAAPDWQPNSMVWNAENTDSLSSTASHQAGDTSVSVMDDMTVVFIPSGEFLMGLTTDQVKTLLSYCPECEEADFDPAKPSHQVYVDGFWIYQTEVTNSMYGRCVDAGSCSSPNNSSSQTRSSYFRNSDYDNYPVMRVNWFDAEQYCRWINGRLPTEAEWEKAARGTGGRLFPWGDQTPNTSLANVYPLNDDTVAVGSYPKGASPFGVLDLVGNVYEWMADWYSPNYYENSDAINPIGPVNGEMGQRSVRGGSWGWGIPFASAAFRDWWEPKKTGSGVGFRCVLDEIH